MNTIENGDITIIELSGDVEAQSSPEIRSKIKTLTRIASLEEARL